MCGYESVAKYQQDSPNGWNHSTWKIKSTNSENFTGFKVYIIKCWNDIELFYKIGKTYVDLKNRFPNKTTMPYNYEVLKIFDGEANEMSKLEHELQKRNKLYKYLPNIGFGGQHECFSQVSY